MGTDFRHRKLSAREVEVVGLIARGMTNNETASELGISPGTVKRHVSNIFNKLDVDNRAKIVGFAYTRLADQLPITNFD